MISIPMTISGAKALEVELLKLRDEDRMRVVEDIATARAHGDLKENAEYHAAKEEQSFIEGRIKEIESKLSCMQVIDVTKLNQDGRCVFGTTVTLLNLDDDSEITYKIVGEDESDIEQGKISCHSPIASSIMGNEEGSEVVVKAPKGDIKYEILEVQYLV
jgi:transcription elongation factor GreA